MLTNELPRTLRQLQSFKRSKTDIDTICMYIKSALGTINHICSLQGPKQNDKNYTEGAIKSTYSYLSDSEKQRLSSQAMLVCDNDIRLLKPVILSLSNQRKMNILDLGCADGYLTKRLFNAFSEHINMIVGIDPEEKCIAIANENADNTNVFRRVEFETVQFEVTVKSIMYGLGIVSFDLIFPHWCYIIYLIRFSFYEE